jgi:hypothetical protein
MILPTRTAVPTKQLQAANQLDDLASSSWHSGTQALLALQFPNLFRWFWHSGASKLTAIRLDKEHMLTACVTETVACAITHTKNLLTHPTPTAIAQSSPKSPLPSLLCRASSVIRLCNQDPGCRTTVGNVVTHVQQYMRLHVSAADMLLSLQTLHSHHHSKRY